MQSGPIKIWLGREPLEDGTFPNRDSPDWALEIIHTEGSVKDLEWLDYELDAVPLSYLLFGESKWEAVPQATEILLLGPDDLLYVEGHLWYDHGDGWETDNDGGFDWDMAEGVVLTGDTAKQVREIWNTSQSNSVQPC